MSKYDLRQDEDGGSISVRLGDWDVDIIVAECKPGEYIIFDGDEREQRSRSKLETMARQTRAKLGGGRGEWPEREVWRPAPSAPPSPSEKGVRTTDALYWIWWPATEIRLVGDGRYVIRVKETLDERSHPSNFAPGSDVCIEDGAILGFASVDDAWAAALSLAHERANARIEAVEEIAREARLYEEEMEDDYDEDDDLVVA